MVNTFSDIAETFQNNLETSRISENCSLLNSVNNANDF